ncbi:heparan-alpha-glucosaminide N-acetyltransferase domain-containing protein [Rhodococcus sp. UNC363MFTsu5.1]|uniref:heparan-alpha-glucosaminide N-acetyltransferase domain-containing protein n=1 Tax=Rhodococcus sp. UNC363MFTsu5.1 TaxID=1449069 RepID=UPI0009E06A7C|nr:heparan-alpha-glucosaminide N-acetyltransferase domain-containing protein [Rhodococcus sp. UNC363MFTsu5.1]
MTQILSQAEAPPTPRSLPRIVGVDVARGLAVLGMIAVHTTSAEQIGEFAHFALSGRAAILFAVLAGVSLALTTGGTRPPERLGAARRSIAARALALFVLGLVLTQLGSPAMVILASYAVLFLIALPLLRLSWQKLAAVAAVAAVAGPLLSYAIRSRMAAPGVAGETARFDMLTSIDGVRHLGSVVLLEGAYPVLTWVPFLLAGMAIGRWGLRRERAGAVLVAVGSALAVLGLGGSWVALNLFGGRNALVAYLDEVMPGEGAQMLPFMLRSSSFGVVGTDPWQWMLTSSPHSGTVFEIVGSGGIAIAVLGLSLLAGGIAPRILTPLAALGSMPLTIYAGHIVALALLLRSESFTYSWALPVWFLVVPLVFATLWQRYLGRGPLEWVLNKVGAGAARLGSPRALG